MRKTLGRWRYFFFVCTWLLSLLSVSHTHSLSKARHNYRLILNPLCSSTVDCIVHLGRILGLPFLNSETIQDRFKDLVLVFVVEETEWDTERSRVWSLSDVVTGDTNLF